MSVNIKEILSAAENISREEKHFFLGVEHLFLALLMSEPWLTPFLSSRGVDREELKKKILEEAGPGGEPLWQGIVHSPRLKLLLGETYPDTRHLLSSILKEGRSIPARVISGMGLNIAALAEEVLTPEIPPKESAKAQSGKDTPLLKQLGRDLTAMARDGKIDPVIGRNSEISRVLQILTRKTKNNPVLIGEAGVGKTAVVYGLALRIAQGKVPEVMKKKRLIDLNLPSVVAGMSHRGEFEERLQKIIKEVSASPDTIVFIDEIHTIVGAGDSKGGMDAGNILKPILARGEFPCIGATTTDEFRKSIEADPALERRFQPVLIHEPSEEETLEILKGIREKYEKHHGVKFSEASLLAAVKLAVRFIPDRHLPDKAIDLVDEAAARVKMRSASGSKVSELLFVVEEEDIADVVSLWTGIPVSKLTHEESKRLLDMETLIGARVVGQEDAVRKVSQTIRMVRTGLGSPSRPGGIFLFLGPTGVGKTELAKALAEFLFGGEKEMIRLDMSEFMEKHTIARLIGSPPGYVGHEEEGQLTGAVRIKPYSVILLDEIEKAHPEVFDLFLQVFDDARLTDSKGRTVNFANSVIIMTSNLGSSRVDDKGRMLLADTNNPEVQEEILQAVRKHFRPEFINRIDELIIFNPLNRESLGRIVEINLEDLRRRLREKDLTLEVDEAARAVLIEEGYEPAYGARPLKRAIQTLIAKPLAAEILEGTLTGGQVVTATEEGGRIVFKKDEHSNEHQA
ncbi:MAG: ATP-dependent Clp protease ATP-binding subunit [bacterium]